MLDLAPYHLTAVASLLGPYVEATGFASTPTPVRRLAVGPRAGEEFTVDVPTHVAALLRLERGPLFTLTVSFEATEQYESSLVVHGSEGTLELPDANGFEGDVRVKTARGDWETVGYESRGAAGDTRLRPARSLRVVARGATAPRVRRAGAARARGGHGGTRLRARRAHRRDRFPARAGHDAGAGRRTRMRRRARLLAVALVGAAVAAAGALADLASQGPDVYRVTHLVSDRGLGARVHDARLVNAWGLAASPTGPWWTANEAREASTLYAGDGRKQALTVDVQGGPTGIVYNPGDGFVVRRGKAFGPARFIYACEDGMIRAWSPVVPHGWSTSAEIAVDQAERGAVFRGLALATLPDGRARIYATDFHNARVVVFDEHWRLVVRRGAFVDRTIPAWYAPFGIHAAGSRVFVSYAWRAPVNGNDSPTGGYVDEFDLDGRLLARVGAWGHWTSRGEWPSCPKGSGRGRAHSSLRTSAAAASTSSSGVTRLVVPGSAPPQRRQAGGASRRLGDRVRERHDGGPSHDTLLRRRAAHVARRLRARACTACSVRSPAVEPVFSAALGAMILYGRTHGACASRAARDARRAEERHPAGSRGDRRPRQARRDPRGRPQLPAGARGARHDVREARAAALVAS